MVRRSGPMPKPKPMYFSGSSPMLRTTLGCTWPEPATSSQRPAKGPLWNWMSISALGSVKGKKLGRKRSTRSSLSKKVLQKSVKTTFRSLKLTRSEEHTSELQSPCNLVCRLLLEKKKQHLVRLLDQATVRRIIPAPDSYLGAVALIELNHATRGRGRPSHPQRSTLPGPRTAQRSR